MAKLTRKQIESLGSMAAPPPKIGGTLVGQGTAGFPSLPINVPANVALGLGTQAGAAPDPPWLVRTADDPAGWKSIAAHAAAAANPAGAVNGTVDLSWLPGAWADPQYWAQIAQNTKASSDADLGYVSGRDRTLGGLGYNFTFDPNDPFNPTGAAQYDPNNPFSQATQLRTHYEAAKRGDTNNLAARGQLYSGALGNQLGLDQSSFNQSDNALISAAQDAVANAITNHRANITGLGQSNLDAQGAAIGRQKPTDPTGVVPATGTAAAPASGATAAKGGSTSVGTPANLPPVRAGTTPNLPFGGVVPGVKPKPYVKPKGYTGKSFVPFGGK